MGRRLTRLVRLAGGSVLLAVIVLTPAACGVKAGADGEAAAGTEIAGPAPVDADEADQGGGEPDEGEPDGAGASGDGAEGGTGDDAPAPVEPSPKDCVSYEPANLTVTSAGGSGWYVRDGTHSLMIFDTQAHASDAVKVARNYTKACYIGRGNDRTDRYRYILQYWESPSGLPLGAAPLFDCTAYDPANLTIAQDGENGWYLLDGETQLALLDSAADAERARLVGGAATRLCIVGGSNARPDWYRYTMEFWR